MDMKKHPMLHCSRCNGEWRRRLRNRDPKKCQLCNSPYWNKSRQPRPVKRGTYLGRDRGDSFKLNMRHNLYLQWAKSGIVYVHQMFTDDHLNPRDRRIGNLGKLNPQEFKPRKFPTKLLIAGALSKKQQLKYGAPSNRIYYNKHDLVKMQNGKSKRHLYYPVQTRRLLQDFVDESIEYAQSQIIPDDKLEMYIARHMGIAMSNDFTEQEAEEIAEQLRKDQKYWREQVTSPKRYSFGDTVHRGRPRKVVPVPVPHGPPGRMVVKGLVP